MEQHPFSLLGFWSQGDLVTKGVAIALLLMSIASWYVIATRFARQLRQRRMAQVATAQFWHAQSFTEGLQLLDGAIEDNPYRHLAEEGRDAAAHHRDNQGDLHGQLTLSDWVTSCLRRAIDDSVERMQSGLSILASVGATAPFVGLLGTVWGIFHALLSIGGSGQVSIGKVAGPVGEALIMTAFGLMVAIPAVLGYNALTRGNNAAIGKINRFAHDLHAYFVTGSPVAKPDSGKARLGAAGGER
ncbi:MotA/TolQ/ExbB proton channel family protein [Chitinimonas arctica]|uniref:Biopolymer transport protein ExbB n=1 Tax=Chitinimonas arctica TaxID=2594795 RepID=A0A516SIJ7_9NEIS|nr:MotA/TolQ/ExbB proton channel family protein [Chitinimonas arctica]QDQ27979.1 MotA/TolQ/ExbB proton channel family protein [Chitinimonas arctica]